jgi:hypothetical protein
LKTLSLTRDQTHHFQYWKEVAEEGQEAMWVEKEIFIVSSKQWGWQSRPPAKKSKTQIE